jgi:uncharacterized protein with NRDE domain
VCLIAFALDAHPRHRLVLAANRDEFRGRPTAPAAWWADAPHVLAGRDLRAGGTWMGVARGPGGPRWAALTNVRDVRRPAPPGARSRGALVADFLRERDDADAYAARVHAGRAAYDGFNLLVGDAAGVWFVSSVEEEPRALAAGVYGLSNASLDTPWPKLTGAVADLRVALADDPLDPAGLLALLDDRTPAPDDALPDTGLGRAWERRLSSRFITGDDYGTRAQMALLLDRDGTGAFAERTVGPDGPDGPPRVFTL